MPLSRRGFLRGLVGVAATSALAAAGYIKSDPKPRRLTNVEKENIIAAALDTNEGRKALAMAMVEPIRRALEYQSVGRKILMVDELPGGAIPYYGKFVS